MSAGPSGVVETFAEQIAKAREIMRPLLAPEATPEACIAAQRALWRAGVHKVLRESGVRWCADRWQLLDARRTAAQRGAA